MASNDFTSLSSINMVIGNLVSPAGDILVMADNYFCTISAEVGSGNELILCI